MRVRLSRPVECLSDSSSFAVFAFKPMLVSNVVLYPFGVGYNPLLLVDVDLWREKWTMTKMFLLKSSWSKSHVIISNSINEKDSSKS